MTKRQRSFAVALVSLLAACLLTLAALWMRGRSADDPDPERAISEGGALTQDQQTPPVPPKTSENEAAEAPGVSASAEEETDGGSKVSRQFLTREAALNFYAELVGEEFDRVEADETITFTPSEPMSEEMAKVWNRHNLNIWGDDPEEEKIIEFGWIALENVNRRIEEEEQYAGLKEALMPIWTEEGVSPIPLLVRAGRAPEYALYDPVMLPNGEVYNMTGQMELIVKYQRKAVLTPKKRRLISDREGQESSLLARLSSGGLSESEAAKLNKELTKVQQELESLRKPVYFDHTKKHLQGDRDHPNFKTVELDIGVVEFTEEEKEEIEEFFRSSGGD